MPEVTQPSNIPREELTHGRRSRPIKEASPQHTDQGRISKKKRKREKTTKHRRERDSSGQRHRTPPPAAKTNQPTRIKTSNMARQGKHLCPRPVATQCPSGSKISPNHTGTRINPLSPSGEAKQPAICRRHTHPSSWLGNIASVPTAKQNNRPSVGDAHIPPMAMNHHLRSNNKTKQAAICRRRTHSSPWLGTITPAPVAGKKSQPSDGHAHIPPHG